MKKSIALILAASTLFLAGCCTTHHVTKWEYQQIPTGSMKSDATLNRFGDEGWSVVGFGTSQTSGNFYIMKRPKQ
jgi:hypothetical protein